MNEGGLVKPLAWVGVVLIVAGAIVLVMKGVGYTKNRTDVEVGPLKVSASEKGFVPPWVGGLAVVLGVGLLVAGKRRA
jgi:hypothetical protein